MAVDANTRQRQRTATDWPTRIRKILHQARSRAQGKGLGFEIDLAYVMELLAENDYRCAQTGIPLQLRDPVTGATQNPYSPSLDRIDNAKGYERGNVQVVCYIFNQAKSIFTDQVVFDFIERVKNRPETVGAENAFRR